MDQMKKLRDAQDAFTKQYEEQIKEHCFNMTTGIARTKENEYSLAVLCQFTDFDNECTDEVRKTIESLLPKQWEHNSVEYPVKVTYMPILKAYS